MYYCTFFCLFFFKTEAVTRYAESGFKLYNPLQMAPLKIWAPQRREGLLFKKPFPFSLRSAPPPLDKNNGLRSPALRPGGRGGPGGSKSLLLSLRCYAAHIKL